MLFDGLPVHHAGQHGLDLLQVLDGAANALAGQVLEGAGLEDRVDLLRHGRQRSRIAAAWSQVPMASAASMIWLAAFSVA